MCGTAFRGQIRVLRDAGTSKVNQSHLKPLGLLTQQEANLLDTMPSASATVETLQTWILAEAVSGAREGLYQKEMLGPLSEGWKKLKVGRFVSWGEKFSRGEKVWDLFSKELC